MATIYKSDVLPHYNPGSSYMPYLDQDWEVLEREDLFYFEPSENSDKVYIFLLCQKISDRSQYRGMTAYGKRGGSLKAGKDVFGTEYHCRSELDTMRSDKRKKGYKTYRKGSIPACANMTHFDVRASGGTQVAPTPPAGLPKTTVAAKVDGAGQFGEPRVLFPMNAQTPKPEEVDVLMDDPGWIVEEKYDGLRLVIHILPGGNRIFSRNAGVDDETRPLEKTASLPHLANLKFLPELYGTILDCEGLIDGKTAAEISGDVNAMGDGSRTQDLYLMVFDVLQYGQADMMNLEWKNRRQVLTKLFKEGLIPAQYPMKLSRYTIRDKRAFYNEIIARGGEGVMLKNIEAIYKPGAKSRPRNVWYKVKRQDTWDCAIIGYTDGQGKYIGQIGAVEFGMYVPVDKVPKGSKTIKTDTAIDENGKPVIMMKIGQTSGMTDTIRLELSNNQQAYMGRVIEVEAREMIKKSFALMHPRFVRFRDDKVKGQCVLEVPEDKETPNVGTSI